MNLKNPSPEMRHFGNVVGLSCLNRIDDAIKYYGLEKTLEDIRRITNKVKPLDAETRAEKERGYTCMLENLEMMADEVVTRSLMGNDSGSCDCGHCPSE